MCVTVTFMGFQVARAKVSGQSEADASRLCDVKLLSVTFEDVCCLLSGSWYFLNLVSGHENVWNLSIYTDGYFTGLVQAYWTVLEQLNLQASVYDS